MRDFFSASTELRMGKNFEEMMKSVPIAITQSTCDISSGITNVTTAHEAIKEQLNKFLKDTLPTLLFKTIEHWIVDFQTCLLTVDKTVGN